MAELNQNLLELIRLQELDSMISQYRRELNTVPEKLQEAGSEYLSIKASIDVKMTHLEQMNKERLSLEHDVKDFAEKIKEREARLYTIKTQKEYQAAVREVGLVKKENKDREDRILKLMEEGEKLSQEITQLKNSVTDKEATFQKIEGDFKAREEELKKGIAEIEVQRPPLVEKVAPALLKKYQAVRERYADAVVGVEKGICQGCHMNIPPQIFNEMLKAGELKNCPRCFRLIYPKQG